MMNLKRSREETSLRTETTAVKTYVQRVLKEGNQSAAHNFGHLNRVATYASLIAQVMGADSREQNLARMGGYLHDLVRSASEVKDDEALSAEKAEPVLRGMKNLKERDISAVLASIRTASVPKELLASQDKDDMTHFEGERRIRLAVWLADKLEANGAYVIARRSQFVGGERYLKQDGDLRGLRLRLLEEGHPLAKTFDPAMAILCESYIRLGFKNNQELYPGWFLPVVNKLFDEQRTFYYALLSSKGLFEEDIADILVSIKFPGVKKNDIESWERRRPKSREFIKRMTEEQINAAKEIVNFFSSADVAYMDTAGAINKFKSLNSVAEEWHRQMLDYLNGGLVELIEGLQRR